MNARYRRPVRSLSFALGVGLAVVGAGCGGEQASDPGATTTSMGQIDHVRENGAKVMPFDLDRSTHTFTSNGLGVVETVTTAEPADPEQVTLIRGHLAEGSKRLAAGNFDDPAAIHGDDMPGLATLRAKASALIVTYGDVPAGGQITYTSADPSVVKALHDFGKAQSKDHAGH